MKSFHKALGQEGEQHARRYLSNLGYLFVSKNYLTPHAEIDLIFRDGEDLVFVEVKSMSCLSVPKMGAPSQKITKEKRRRITLAAAHFLEHHPSLSAGYPRFDVVEVTFHPSGPVFSHYKHAFEAERISKHKKLF